MGRVWGGLINEKGLIGVFIYFRRLNEFFHYGNGIRHVVFIKLQGA